MFKLHTNSFTGFLVLPNVHREVRKKGRKDGREEQIQIGALHSCEGACNTYFRWHEYCTKIIIPTIQKCETQSIKPYYSQEFHVPRKLS